MKGYRIETPHILNLGGRWRAAINLGERAPDISFTE
jgi:hypothetical protein